jgi:hypothetical protein
MILFLKLEFGKTTTWFNIIDPQFLLGDIKRMNETTLQRVECLNIQPFAGLLFWLIINPQLHWGSLIFSTFGTKTKQNYAFTFSTSQ